MRAPTSTIARLVRAQAFVLTVIAVGCVKDLYPRVDVIPQKLSSGQYQVWHGQAVMNWTHVIISVDSVSGTLTKCHGHECHRSLPRTAVDSIRLHKRVGTVGGALLATALGIAALYALVRWDTPP
jgi:hypothetical protein